MNRECPLITRSPAEALDEIRRLYDDATRGLRDAFRTYTEGQDLPGRVRAFYPRVRLRTSNATRTDARLSFGFVAGPGVYETTVTRPDLFGPYLLTQSPYEGPRRAG